MDVPSSGERFVWGTNGGGSVITKVLSQTKVRQFALLLYQNALLDQNSEIYENPQRCQPKVINLSHFDDFTRTLLVMNDDSSRLDSTRLSAVLSWISRQLCHQHVSAKLFSVEFDFVWMFC